MDPFTFRKILPRLVNRLLRDLQPVIAETIGTVLITNWMRAQQMSISNSCAEWLKWAGNHLTTFFYIVMSVAALPVIITRIIEQIKHNNLQSNWSFYNNISFACLFVYGAVIVMMLLIYGIKVGGFFFFSLFFFILVWF